MSEGPAEADRGVRKFGAQGVDAGAAVGEEHEQPGRAPQQQVRDAAVLETQVQVGDAIVADAAGGDDARLVDQPPAAEQLRGGVRGEAAVDEARQELGAGGAAALALDDLALDLEGDDPRDMTQQQDVGQAAVVGVHDERGRARCRDGDGEERLAVGFEAHDGRHRLGALGRGVGERVEHGAGRRVGAGREADAAEVVDEPQAAADGPLEPLEELAALRADGRVARRLVQAQGLEHAGVLLGAVGVRDGPGEGAERHLVGGEQQRQAAFVGGAVETAIACALRTDSTVTCWGVGTPGLTFPASPLTGLAANGIGFCALNPDATLACWAGVFGGVVPTGVAQFSGGADFNCAVLTDGTLACWGNPSAPPPAGTFLSVATGASHACAVRTDHTVACWGDNTFFESQPPVGTFTAVSAAPGVSCGLRTDGTLVCWPGGAAAPGPPAPAAPAAPVASATTPQSGVPGVRLPRLPAAFGTNGVFVLPSNRSCVSRRNFRIRVRRQRAGVTLVSAAVSVNGRRVAVRRGARLTAPVDLRGLPRGRFTVRIGALTADGRAIVGTRRYRTCAPRRASGGHGPLVLAAALPREGR